MCEGLSNFGGGPGPRTPPLGTALLSVAKICCSKPEYVRISTILMWMRTKIDRQEKKINEFFNTFVILLKIVKANCGFCWAWRKDA